MSGHTPGPWALVESKDPRIISSWCIEIGERQISLFPYRRIYSEDRTQSGYDIDKEQMANARLIAAAPDLLAALKSARDELMGLPRSLAYEFTHLPSIEAAIAKAEGA